MAEEVVWRVLVLAGGKATSVHEYGEKEAALAAIRGVAAGLGVKGGAAMRLAGGAACWQGGEAGGWSILLWRHTRPASAPVKPAGRVAGAVKLPKGGPVAVEASC